MAYFQTPLKEFDVPVNHYDSATSFGPDGMSPYQSEYNYNYTPARFPAFPETMNYTPTFASQVTTTEVPPCTCIHCEKARVQLRARFEMQTADASIRTDDTVEVDDKTPAKAKSTPVRKGPVHYHVMVICRHKQCSFMSKIGVTAGDFVVVEGDRGEDIGEVVSCERVDPTAAPKTSGNVLREAKQSEVDAFHALEMEEQNCTDECQRMVDSVGLTLTIKRAAYQFDRKKLTFFYEAPERVDFRALLHDLYQIYRCRIWMERVE